MAKKKLTPEEATVKIREAANKGNITMASSDEIDSYEAIARTFLNDMLAIDYDKCFISDESCLSDFSSCGMPDDSDLPGTLTELYVAWDTFIIDKIYKAYGITVHPSFYLIDIFEMIRQDQLRMKS